MRISLVKQYPCAGKLKVIASIEDTVTIHRVLVHLDRKASGPL